MKKMIFLFIISCLLTTISAFSQEKKRVAIIDLQPKGTSEIIAGAATDMIRSELVKSGALSIVERTQMDEILKEQGFQTSGCTDQSCAVKIGKLLAAHKILVGELNKVGKSFLITVRTVDVEKGLSEHSANAKAESEEVIDVACKNISRELLDNMLGRDRADSRLWSPAGYYLRSIIPGWGQFYSGKTTKGYIFLGSFIAAGGFMGYCLFDFYSKKKDYENMKTGSASDFKTKRDEAEDAATMSKISIGIFAGVYLIHWVDALFFSKPDFSKTRSGILNIGSENAYFSFDINNHYTNFNEKYYNMKLSLRF